MLIKRNGFSLLELLVVVAIIGILIAIGTVAFSTAQQRSRDARRRGDVNAWQDALEQTYSVHTSYTGGGSGCTVAVEENLNGIAPTDPKTRSSYATNCSSDSYCVCAELEQAGSGNSTNNSCSFNAAGGDFFCATNLQ